MTRKIDPDTSPAESDAKTPADPAAMPANVSASAVGEGEHGGATGPLSANKISVARAAKAREDRLAAALRTNLSRRKAAARAARDTDPGEEG